MTHLKRLHEIAQPIFVAEVYIFSKNKLLMFKRSEKKKKFPGFWSIPGGHIEEGEDPLSAAIREAKEETGVSIDPKDICLKVVALHHHLDRGELYVSFAFMTTLNQNPSPLINNEEGQGQWIKKEDAFLLDNVFEPVRYYFDHVLNDKPGIVYNNSQWENSKLVKVLSQTIDNNG